MTIKIICRAILLSAAACLFSYTLIAAPAEETIYNPSNTLKGVLANGMTVIVHELHKTPVVSIDIIVNTGSSSEGDLSGSGISHFLEHMLFKGAEGRQTGDVAKEIKSLGGEINAFTSREYTGYTVTVPSEYLKDTLLILKKFIFAPSFDTVELQKEKEKNTSPKTTLPSGCMISK